MGERFSASALTGPGAYRALCTVDIISNIYIYKNVKTQLIILLFFLLVTTCFGPFCRPSSGHMYLRKLKIYSALIFRLGSYQVTCIRILYSGCADGVTKNLVFGIYYFEEWCTDV